LTLPGNIVDPPAAASGIETIDFPRLADRDDDGMHRWVGLGVIADTLINMGSAKAASPTGLATTRRNA
jgi:hypothetical protein